MKTLKFLPLFLFMAATASATNIGDFWSDLKSKSELRLGDNVAPGTFYNMKKNATADQRLLSGVVTTLFSYRVVDLNYTLLKEATTGNSPVSGFSVGLNLNPIIVPLASKASSLLGENADSPLFQRLRIGGFYAKDFRDHRESFGVGAYWVFGNSN